MKAWKLWSLCALLSMGVACSGNGGTNVDEPETGCEGLENGTPCADDSICNEGTCVPIQIHNECEGTGNGEPCGNGICYGNACRNPADVPCASGGSFCEGEDYSCNAGTCQPPLPPQPTLSHARFSSDCSSIELSGQPGIQLPAAFASSTGSISTLCPEGVRGDSTGFSCPSSANQLAPGEYTAYWTVEDDRGGVSSAPAYSFQTLWVDTAPLFPLERAMPLAVLGYDLTEGRQVLTSRSPEACWEKNTTLRGSIAAGEYHSCALREDGTVHCWGANGNDQRSPPRDLSSVVAVSAGEIHTCALRADGTVRCWGENDPENALVGRTAVPAGLNSAVAIAVGNDHSCALLSSGTVHCWGARVAYTNEGQTAVPRDLNEAVAIAAGYSHTCALRADGTVRCWGRNSNNQLTPPEDLGPAVAIDAGLSHTCALQANGAVRCWGGNSNRQSTPPEDLGPVVAIATGRTHTCALRADGTVHCWGMYDNQQPTPPEDLEPAVAIAAGGFHTCALQADGAVRCWGGAGLRSYGQAAGCSGAAVQTVGQLVISQ